MTEAIRQAIWQEICCERARQDRLFGGPAHDDQHSMMDWIGILVRHLGLAVDDGKPGGGLGYASNNYSACANPARYRRQLVRTAAVAMAAIESFDRKVADYQPGEPSTLADASGNEASPLADLAWWQGRANATGEVLLLVSRRNPKSNAEGPQGRYTIPESMASDWEKANYDARLIPVAKQE